MARIKLAILRSTKAKDGSYKIRLAIGHKSETHYIVTRFSVPSLANFRNGTIIGTPTAHHDNLKLRQLLTDYEDRLDRIPNLSELTPVELRDTLKRMSSTSHSATIMEMFAEQTKRKKEDGRTTRFIDFSQKTFAEFLHGDTALQNITPATIDSYYRSMKNRGFANTTINNQMQQLRTVINNAIRDGYVKYDTHPFSYWHALPRPFKDSDISVEDMRKIIHLQTNVKRLIITRDVLLLSYYLGGINLIDLINIDFHACNGLLDYIRTKTKNTSCTRVQLSIHPKAQQIIDKYIGSDGHLYFGKIRTHNALTCILNRNVKTLGEAAGIRNAKSLTFYTARKSFVQHGFDLGIPLETLEYCVGHTSGHSRTIYNYMRVMRKHADDAINRIITHLYNE